MQSSPDIHCRVIVTVCYFFLLTSFKLYAMLPRLNHALFNTWSDKFSLSRHLSHIVYKFNSALIYAWRSLRAIISASAHNSESWFGIRDRFDHWLAARDIETNTSTTRLINPVWVHRTIRTTWFGPSRLAIDAFSGILANSGTCATWGISNC